VTDNNERTISRLSTVAATAYFILGRIMALLIPPMDERADIKSTYAIIVLSVKNGAPG
jgi:hypothetical protein